MSFDNKAIIQNDNMYAHIDLKRVLNFQTQFRID